MYITVKLTWIILAAVTIAATLITWKYPKWAVPLTVGMAAAAVIAAITHV